MSSVYDLIKAAIAQAGAAGLCNQYCACDLDDFAPCGDGPFPDCELADVYVVPEDMPLVHPITGEIISCPDASPGDKIFYPMVKKHD